MTEKLPRMNLLGQRFGKLLVASYIGKNKSGASTWRCVCDCGGETTAHTGELRAGKRKGCSCNLSRPKHGMHNSRLHRIWSSMKSRCQNPNKIVYSGYGGRGIYVCEAWQKFIPFMEWSLANGYAENLELDRTDNDGPYSPENCRWVTHAVNMQNRRPGRPLGLRYTVREIRFACGQAGVDPEALFAHMPRKRVYT